MTVAIPTRAELLLALQVDHETLIEELTPARFSDTLLRLEALADALYGLYNESSAVYRDMFPQGALAEALDKHAAVKLGPYPRKGATTAQGADALKVYGVAGTVVAAGETLVHSSGARYQLTTGGTIGAAPDEYVLCDVESITTGEEAIREIGDTLTFEAPPTGITAIADVVVAVDGAEDAELDEELRARLLDAYANPPSQAGTFADFRQWALAITGVHRAYAYGPSSADIDGRRGLGIVDVAILRRGSGSARIPSETLRQAVQDDIDARRPAGDREASALAPTAVEVDVDVRLEPRGGYEWDWAGTGAEVVGGWTAGTRELVWSALPATVQAGHRIMVLGQLRTVESIPAANTTKLTEAFVTAPSGGESIYPGGPLSAPAQAALLALFDTLGPARGSAADPEQDWEDTLWLSAIIAAVVEQRDGSGAGVTGCRTASIVAPATNTVPDDTPPAAPELLVPGTITVRPLL